MVQEKLTILGGLGLGLVTSLHCAGMCGPLICGLGFKAKTETQRMVAAMFYHTGRLFSYALFGALWGFVGEKFLKLFFNSPTVILPWILVVLLLLYATGLTKKLPRPTFYMKWTTRWRFALQKLPVEQASFLFGVLTPLLPCAPLYTAFAASAMSGSAMYGATVMLAFGAGTLPLLWTMQFLFFKFQIKMNPRIKNYLLRATALICALMIGYRMRDRLPFEINLKSSDSKIEKSIPKCCHGEGHE